MRVRLLEAKEVYEITDPPKRPWVLARVTREKDLRSPAWRYRIKGRDGEYESLGTVRQAYRRASQLLDVLNALMEELKDGIS